MSPSKISPLVSLKALTFDVFGTVVDWRTSVNEELTLRACRKQLSHTVSTELKSRLASMTEGDWQKFAQEWRNSYGEFTRGFDPSGDAWKTVDEHHRDSLVQILKSWNLEGLYSEAEIESLSLVWHRLTPWSDASAGLSKFNRSYTTSTLSNGNVDLLADLVDFGNLPFQRTLCAETFRAYKPNRAVYLGAAEELGCEPGEVGMVAAHLGDLQAEKGCGFRTIYIERPGEEEWRADEERYIAAREWVDVWVGEDEDGFMTLADNLSEVS